MPSDPCVGWPRPIGDRWHSEKEEQRWTFIDHTRGSPVTRRQLRSVPLCQKMLNESPARFSKVLNIMPNLIRNAIRHPQLRRYWRATERVGRIRRRRAAKLCTWWQNSAARCFDVLLLEY